MWWIFAIAVIGYIIYKMRSEHGEEVERGVTAYGGMQEKYSILINHFVDAIPARVTKLTKDSVTISASAMMLQLDYIAGNLEVQISGIAPGIGRYHNRWKFPNGYPQERMIEEITNYLDWQVDIMLDKMQ